MQNPDWPEIVFQLQKKGLTPEKIGKVLNVSRPAVIAYRDKGQNPRYEHGLALVDLWMKHYFPRMGR